MLLKRNESLKDFIDAVKGSELFEEGMRKRVCGEIVSIARSIKPRIVVNRARNAYEAQIASNILAKYAREHLLVEPENLGFVYFDRRVSDTINSGVPIIVSYPKLKISACIGDIANRLGYV